MIEEQAFKPSGYPKDKVKVGIETAQEALIEELANADIHRIRELISYIEKQQAGHKQEIGDNYELIGSLHGACASGREDIDIVFTMLGQIYSDIDTVFE